ncbi:unnamed protein product [Closterium sp. Yama58-4]|nr:unnamed protein product [Closterium sp. Yama58-4]
MWYTIRDAFEKAWLSQDDDLVTISSFREPESLKPETADVQNTSSSSQSGASLREQDVLAKTLHTEETESTDDGEKNLRYESQEWQFLDAGDGYHTIKNRHSGDSIRHWRGEDVTAVPDADVSNFNHQWKLYDVGNGLVAIRNRCTGMVLARCLDAVMAYNGDERNPNHWWKIEEVSPSAVYYVGPWEYLRNRRSGRVLQHSHHQQTLTDSVKPGSSVNPTSTNTVQSVKAVELIPGDVTQQWRRVAVSEGYTCLQNRSSGFLLTVIYEAPLSSSLRTTNSDTTVRGASDSRAESCAITTVTASLAAALPVEEAQARNNEVTREGNQWLLAEVNGLEIFTLQSRQGGAFLENTCGEKVRGSLGAVEASTCCQWAAIRADELDDVAKATVDDVAGSPLELFKAPRKSKAAVLLEAPKKSMLELALGKSTPLQPVLQHSLPASPSSLPDDSTPATPTTPAKLEPLLSPSPQSGSSQPPHLMPKLLSISTELTEGAFDGGLESRDKGIDGERYSTTALPVLLPWSYLRNRVTGMALAAHASGSVEAREFEGGSLQQHWRAVSVGRVASAPAVSYFFLQNRASGFVLSHSWWGSHVAANDCHVAGEYSQWELRGACGGFWAIKNRGSGKVLDHFFGISIQAYSEDELQYQHHWTITPAGTTGGKAHWEQEEEESGDKWCKAVQGGGEGMVSLALVVDRSWSYVFNRDSGKALAVCEENVEAVDYEWGALEQQWRVVKTEKGYHVLQNRVSGLVLDHYSGQRIGAYDNDFSSEYHKWQLRDIEGGVYVVLKNKKTGMVLDHYYWERLEAVRGDEKNKAQHWRVVPARQMVREGMGPQPSPETETVVGDLISLWERDSVPKGKLKGVYLVEGGKPRHGIRVVKSGFRQSRQIHLLQVSIQGLAYASVAVPAGVEVGRGRIRAALRRSAEGGGEVVVVDSLDLMRIPEVEGPLVNLVVFVGVAAEQVCM